MRKHFLSLIGAATVAAAISLAAQQPPRPISPARTAPVP